MLNYKIETLVLKVVAPCNLNCSYCYEYNMGDDSWKKKPKKISEDLINILAKKLNIYCNKNSIEEFTITLHGGEPLMLSVKELNNIFSILKREIKISNLRFGMQTNGTLFTKEKINILNNFNVNVGISIDGDKYANKYRVDLKGKEVFEKIIQGVNRAKKEINNFSGFLSVVNLNADPEKVLKFLLAFEPYQIDLLPPFGNYSNPPFLTNTKYSYSEWMIRAFDYWSSNPEYAKTRIRYLEDALYSIVNGVSKSDWFGLKPPGYLVINTEGDIEGLDTLKVANGGRELGLNIIKNTIEEALQSEEIKNRSLMFEGLPDLCKNCEIVKWCSGGYYPTRYSKENNFNNPSYYCKDLKNLFFHLSKWVEKQKEH